MDNFKVYAHYYDLIYNQKDYVKEVNYLINLFERFAMGSVKSILDFGCGTGKHSFQLSKSGYNVDGIDLSQNMIDMAIKNYGNNPRLSFNIGDIRTHNKNKKYDTVISLFHVISYQTKNEDLLKCFGNASRHLDTGGLFIFDFWYGPGVLTDRPEVRVRQLQNDEVNIWRKANPIMHANLNLVEVNYELKISTASKLDQNVINERHSMRYLFKPELDYFLERSGFKVAGFFEWMSMIEPGFDTWNAVIVAKKG